MDFISELINWTYLPKNNGGRLTKQRSGNEGIAGGIVHFNYFINVRFLDPTVMTNGSKYLHK